MRLFDRAVVRVLPAVPRGVVRRVAAPYIAGETLEDARRVVKQLNAAGIRATVDVLGEDVSRPEEAEAIARAYHDALAAIEAERLDANVSIKLTGFGLELDKALCRSLVEALVEDAATRGIFVRIDMEDSSTTDDTLDLYRALRGAGHDNDGIVLQAALRRTLDDIATLADLLPNVRLCKGIYLEPPELAYRDFDSIRASFVHALEALLEAGCYVGIATHDEWLLEQGQRLVSTRGLGREDYEFQMLLGVRPALGDELVRGGHRLRIYTPFGRHWYAYSLRRLQENPKIAGYIAADTVGRFIPGRNGSS